MRVKVAWAVHLEIQSSRLERDFLRDNGLTLLLSILSWSGLDFGLVVSTTKAGE